MPVDISDRGAQFTSGFWTAMSQLLGTQLHHTTAYHPNGLVERFHRQMKASLRAQLTGPHWMDKLPWVMLGIRTAPKEDLGTSSAELMYGAPLTVPGDFIPAAYGNQELSTPMLTRLRERVGRLSPIPTSRHGLQTPYVPPNLQDCQYVFVRRHSHRTLLQKQNYLTAFIIDRGGKPETVAVDRLKPAHLSTCASGATPPQRATAIKTHTTLTSTSCNMESNKIRPPISTY